MRILLLLMSLLVSACVSNAPGEFSGSQEKSGWSAADKILYADEIYSQPRTGQCSGSRVLYCSVGQSGSNCRCMFARDIDARADQLFGSREHRNSRYGQRHRRRN